MRNEPGLEWKLNHFVKLFPNVFANFPKCPVIEGLTGGMMDDQTL